MYVVRVGRRFRPRLSAGCFPGLWVACSEGPLAATFTTMTAGIMTAAAIMAAFLSTAAAITAAVWVVAAERASAAVWVAAVAAHASAVPVDMPAAIIER